MEVADMKDFDINNIKPTASIQLDTNGQSIDFAFQENSVNMTVVHSDNITPDDAQISSITMYSTTTVNLDKEKASELIEILSKFLNKKTS